MDVRKKKLPIGIENFEDIRKEPFYYADKTGLLVELLDSWPAALASSNLFHLHDLDGVGTGTVSGTHV